jgi:pyridoxamine 5'-phosphate oxidase
MNFQDCLDFANANPIAWVATTEGDQPRVRALGLWFANEKGFYFQIGGNKDVYQQLLKNPRVEIGFYRPDEGVGTMLRVSGPVEWVDDPELKKKVLEDRPFLKQFGLTPEHPGLVIFRIARGEAHFWTMSSNLGGKEILRFGE